MDVEERTGRISLAYSLMQSKPGPAQQLLLCSHGTGELAGNCWFTTQRLTPLRGLRMGAALQHMAVQPDRRSAALEGFTHYWSSASLKQVATAEYVWIYGSCKHHGVCAKGTTPHNHRHQGVNGVESAACTSSTQANAGAGGVDLAALPSGAQAKRRRERRSTGDWRGGIRRQATGFSSPPATATAGY